MTEIRYSPFQVCLTSYEVYDQDLQDQLGFEIDYPKSVVEIFRSFTILMMAKYGDLRALATRHPNRAYDDRYLDVGVWTGPILMMGYLCCIASVNDLGI